MIWTATWRKHVELEHNDKITKVKKLSGEEIVLRSTRKQAWIKRDDVLLQQKNHCLNLTVLFAQIRRTKKFHSSVAKSKLITITYQLLWTHVIQDALSVFTVVSTLHDSQQQLWRIILKPQSYQLALLTKRMCSIVSLAEIWEPFPGWEKWTILNLHEIRKRKKNSRLHFPGARFTLRIWCLLNFRGWSTQGLHLELEHEVHALLAERVDVVEDERDDDVDAVALVTRDRVLQVTQVKNPSTAATDSSEESYNFSLQTKWLETEHHW